MVIVNDKAITRRGLIRGGAFCAFGLMASSLVCPRTGFAFQQSCDPVVRVEIRRGEKGAAAGLFESRLFAPRCQSSDKTGISIQSSSLSRDGSVELYSGVCSIPFPWVDTRFKKKSQMMLLKFMSRCRSASCGEIIKIPFRFNEEVFLLSRRAHFLITPILLMP